MAELTGCQRYNRDIVYDSAHTSLSSTAHNASRSGARLQALIIIQSGFGMLRLPHRFAPRSSSLAVRTVVHRGQLWNSAQFPKKVLVLGVLVPPL
jgi:hypothetical protein